MDERLQELALHNPIVYNFVMHWKCGGFSYEEALVECVLALAEINKKQFEQLVENELRRTPDWIDPAHWQLKHPK